ncbi:hypothetical protein RUM43_010904 [Polyplax serrata]|uniref:Uncharacterized protein n=1 Tax=Polyplax serrata TaxID=468196 RepID=A0AAN8S0K0_POLSC
MNVFCDCSPLDTECHKVCSQVVICDDKSDECNVRPPGSDGQPNYPTYPPPPCGGIGQVDCPYPPAGIKPEPAFTYPPSVSVDNNENCANNPIDCSSPSTPSGAPDTSHETNLTGIDNQNVISTGSEPDVSSSEQPFQKPLESTSVYPSFSERPKPNPVTPEEGIGAAGGANEQVKPICGYPGSQICESGGLPPIYVIPFPVPIVPAPGNCPCYLLSPTNGSASTLPSPVGLPGNYTEGNLPQGIIGYIPVVFFPSCSQNHTNAEMIQPYFPQAYAIPYPCQQCQPTSKVTRTNLEGSPDQVHHNDQLKPPRFTDPNFYSLPVSNFAGQNKFIPGESTRRGKVKIRRRIARKDDNSQLSNSFLQVMKQGNIEMQQVVKSPHRSSRALGKKTQWLATNQ